MSLAKQQDTYGERLRPMLAIATALRCVAFAADADMLSQTAAFAAAHGV